MDRYTRWTADEAWHLRHAINRRRRLRLGFANRHEDRAHDKQVRKERLAAQKLERLATMKTEGGAK